MNISLQFQIRIKISSKFVVMLKTAYIEQILLRSTSPDRTFVTMLNTVQSGMLSITYSLDCILTKVPSITKPCFIFYRVSLPEIFSYIYMPQHLFCTVFHKGLDFVLFTAVILVPRTVPVI
uniref:Uncharacterized protein n=1 Tax=Molossus molossus TaxID=27622 RepID=A0A7J8GLQ0_MOLMO|nr:hypothetical protein HJG59_011520 [Molossus molossus]